MNPNTGNWWQSSRGMWRLTRRTSSSSNWPTEYHEPEGVTQTLGTTFRLQEITANKLKELLKQYKGGGKALGEYELDGYIIKTASRGILPALLHIINLSIKEGQFAYRWKFE